MNDQALQFAEKKDPSILTISIPCPGLTKKDITLAFDRKEGKLEVSGDLPEDSKLDKALDLKISGTIQVDKKYRSDTVEATVEEGILVITLGLSKDVAKIDIK